MEEKKLPYSVQLKLKHPLTYEQAKEIALEILGVDDESEISDSGAYDHSGDWFSERTVYNSIMSTLGPYGWDLILDPEDRDHNWHN
tara:strand:- start:1161 stop:1418 length:258 start_codon:yes stop_codon:yes gene_type:complete